MSGEETIAALEERVSVLETQVAELMKSGEGKEKNGKDISTDRFELFYEKYPKKVSKYDAFKKFKKVCKTEEDFKAIMAGLERYLKTSMVANGYAKSPELWLSGRRWEDGEVVCLNNNGKPKSGTDDIMNDDFFREKQKADMAIFRKALEEAEVGKKRKEGGENGELQ